MEQNTFWKMRKHLYSLHCRDSRVALGMLHFPGPRKRKAEWLLLPCYPEGLHSVGRAVQPWPSLPVKQGFLFCPCGDERHITMYSMCSHVVLCSH